MRLHVSAQIGSIGERSSANVTLERFLARVRAHMTLQQPRTTETLAADFALARQRVRSDVHLKRAQ